MHSTYTRKVKCLKILKESCRSLVSIYGNALSSLLAFHSDFSSQQMKMKTLSNQITPAITTVTTRGDSKCCRK